MKFDRELFFQALQIAVVAPYIYNVSGKIDSDYFRIGLKLVAGSIVVMNAKPIINAAMPTMQRALDIYMQQNGYKKDAPKVSNTIDGEYRKV